MQRFQFVVEALPTVDLESSPSVILTSSQAQVPPPHQTPPELATPVPSEHHEEEKGEHSWAYHVYPGVQKLSFQQALDAFFCKAIITQQISQLEDVYKTLSSLQARAFQEGIESSFVRTLGAIIYAQAHGRS